MMLSDVCLTPVGLSCTSGLSR